MWYEILPFAGMTWLCLVTPGISLIYFYRYANGGKEKRLARVPFEWTLMERDRYVSGVNTYHRSKGLENID